MSRLANWPIYLSSLDLRWLIYVSNFLIIKLKCIVFYGVFCWLDRGSSAKSVTAVKTILRKRNWMSLQQDGHVTTCLNFRWDYHWSFAQVKMSQLRKISNDPLYCTKYQLISILGIHHFPRISTLIFIWELRETYPLREPKIYPFSLLSLSP